MGRQIAGTDVNWKKALKEGWMSAVRQGRSFGAVGSSYAVCECIIESVSAKDGLQHRIHRSLTFLLLQR